MTGVLFKIEELRNSMSVMRRHCLTLYILGVNVRDLLTADLVSWLDHILEVQTQPLTLDDIDILLRIYDY